MFARRDMTVNKSSRTLTLAVLALASAAALANPNLDATQWIQRISQAAQKLNYSGTFVYLQQGGLPQTSRITHMNDGGVERERLEMLEGLPVVVVRTNDEVRSYLPDSKTVLIEKRRAKATFPALASMPAAAQGATPGSTQGAASAALPGAGQMAVHSVVHSAAQGAQLPVDFSGHYNVRKWDTQRIAGLDCQVLLLEPKDGLRYTHKLWADINSGLLLKAQSFNEKGEVVEQIGFTQVEIGGLIEKYLAKFSKRDGGPGWRTATAQVWDASLVESGWKIDPALPGFRKISEMKRNRDDGVEVGQVVFSDGLTSVSVFVEPARAGVKTREGVSSHGAVSVYRRTLGDHLVTVLGEAPAACVTRIARSIEFRPVAAAPARAVP